MSMRTSSEPPRLTLAVMGTMPTTALKFQLKFRPAPTLKPPLMGWHSHLPLLLL